MELFARIRVYVLTAESESESWVVERVASIERAFEMVSESYVAKPIRLLAVVLGEKDV
jgi:hypothetical protein